MSSPRTISPVRKRLIAISEMLDNAKYLAKRSESAPDDDSLRKRAAFCLREVQAEIADTLKIIQEQIK